MSKKSKVKVEKDNSERWLLTYSDLMNLLLILFIILYASSMLDAAKFQRMAESLREGFNSPTTSQPAAANTNSSIPSDAPPIEDPSALVNDAEIIQNAQNAGAAESQAAATIYKDFYDELMQLLEENNLTQSVTVKNGEKAIIISFADTVLFAKSSAVLNDTGYSIIDKIGSLLIKLPYSYILVEGHADSDKIHNRYYEDNMDLSAKRASNVWRRLVVCSLPPDKMASVGYGEYRPVVANDSIENKAKNRRVVVTILKEQISIKSSDNASENNTKKAPE
jgi:chemotaxis protein MotB